MAKKEPQAGEFASAKLFIIAVGDALQELVGAVAST
jgi:hypothetical protein